MVWAKNGSKGGTCRIHMKPRHQEKIAEDVDHTGH